MYRSCSIYRDLQRDHYYILNFTAVFDHFCNMNTDFNTLPLAGSVCRARIFGPLRYMQFPRLFQKEDRLGATADQSNDTLTR